MATDNFFLDRLRNILSEKHIVWTEKRMFGGDCFMVDEKMLLGTFRGQLMARIDHEEKEQLLERPGANVMEMNGRIMKGYLLIDAEATDLEEDLEFWVQKCLEFNPKAKASKKRKKKA